jgi:hypothetical protein
MFCSLTSPVIPTPKHEVLNEPPRLHHAARRCGDVAARGPGQQPGKVPTIAFLGGPTASAAGQWVEIPASILLRADRVIE